jgi:hypothetical protein
MANRHIKVINGRRYYYESIRKGKRVLSRYIGPVDGRIRTKRRKLAEETAPQEEQEQEQQYIG